MEHTTQNYEYNATEIWTTQISSAKSSTFLFEKIRIWQI